jgi:hypothetical protein
LPKREARHGLRASGVDAVIQDRGIENMAELHRISAQDFGDWLDVDAVMYGRVVHYEAYYLALVAACQVGIEVRLVSTRDGKTLIKASGSRWAVSLLPAMDPPGHRDQRRPEPSPTARHQPGPGGGRGMPGSSQADP